MDIHSVRQMLRSRSVYEIPLRVTYYADFIRKNAAWTFVPGYIDEGLSGISTKRRENFNRKRSDHAQLPKCAV